MLIEKFTWKGLGTRAYMEAVGILFGPIYAGAIKRQLEPQPPKHSPRKVFILTISMP
jgi:hypothetical protein